MAAGSQAGPRGKVLSSEMMARGAAFDSQWQKRAPSSTGSSIGSKGLEGCPACTYSPEPAGGLKYSSSCGPQGDPGREYPQPGTSQDVQALGPVAGQREHWWLQKACMILNTEGQACLPPLPTDFHRACQRAMGCQDFGL
jgi:hypothetical protein